MLEIYLGVGFRGWAEESESSSGPEWIRVFCLPVRGVRGSSSVLMRRIARCFACYACGIRRVVTNDVDLSLRS